MDDHDPRERALLLLAQVTERRAKNAAADERDWEAALHAALQAGCTKTGVSLSGGIGRTALYAHLERHPAADPDEA